MGGCGRGRGDGGRNSIRGAAGGGRKVKPPGLNSMAEAFSGLPKDDRRVCPKVGCIGPAGGGSKIPPKVPGAHEPD